MQHAVHGRPRASCTKGLVALLALLQACQSAQDCAVYTEGPAAPRKVPLRIQGNESVDSEVLARAVTSKPELRRKDGSLDLPGFRRVLVELYRRRGYADADVKVALEPADAKEPADAGEQLRITVQEGPRVLIESLTLEGNSSIPSAELLESWTRSSASIFGESTRSYVPSQIARLVQEIQARYVNGGYLQARVSEPRVERSEDETRARIVIPVREGPIFTVRGYEVSERVRAVLGEVEAPGFEGETFDATRIETHRRRLVRDLRELGHATPALRVTIAKVAGKNEVDVMVGGEVGDPARFGELRVEGNRRVTVDKIRRAFEFAPGDAFRGSVEDRGVQALMTSGDFARVEIEHEARDDGRVDLVVRVAEVFKPPFEPSVAYQSYERVTGVARLALDDVLGLGLDVRGRGEVHHKGHLLSASLVRPDLGAGTSLSLGVAKSRQRQPSFNDEVLAAEALLRHELRGPLQAEFGYRFEDHDDSWSDTADPSADRAVYERGLLRAGLVSDLRDHPQRPRVGHAFRLGAEWSDEALGGDLDATHASLDFTKWLRVADSLHLMARVRSDAVWSYGAGAVLPIQERLFLGGEDSVRSFREDQASPKDRDGEALGGSYRNLLQLEARLAVHPEADLVLFGDAGNAGRSVHAYGLSRLRYALGVGLHALFQNRMPIRFDAAWNPDRAPGEEEWVLHLRVGVVD